MKMRNKKKSLFYTPEAPTMQSRINKITDRIITKNERKKLFPQN
jgi:hypothetical protein